MMVGDMERLKQHSRGTGYILDGGVECNLVGSRRRIEPADLPDELKRSVMQLLVCRVMSRVPESFDVSAHISSFCVRLSLNSDSEEDLTS
jgi:hypothetical protein